MYLEYWLPCVLCFLGGILLAVVVTRVRGARGSSRSWMPNVMRAHFRTRNPELLLVGERRFPLHMRGELARALDGLFGGDVRLRQCLGIKKDHPFSEASFAELVDHESRLFAIAPQFEELHVGEDEPLRVVRNGVWLGERAGTPFAVISTQDASYCGDGYVRLQVATPNHRVGSDWAREVFRACEEAVARGSLYRGKILSFESPESYTGETSGITIHRLPVVGRDQVILPPRILTLLERNVMQFAQQRAELTRLGQAAKKGLLFYGPPGTGKTHTIHYLARAVPEQTVFLIAAEQVKHLSNYMTLARLLQPSMVVVEDVDLIAKDREDQCDPSSEVLLNKLLNEMDGLKEDAAVLFVLTTNRPQSLETALTARPGRIDQAIEFPLPDADGREQLVRLYARGIALDDSTVGRLVSRTDGVSAAFIKEAVRRSIQFCITRNGHDRLEAGDIDLALEEMLTEGGLLNRTLLGAGHRHRVEGPRAADAHRGQVPVHEMG